jgi:hypothetical protein
MATEAAFQAWAKQAGDVSNVDLNTQGKMYGLYKVISACNLTLV